MAKRFNGRKMSHGLASRAREKCPICRAEMVRFCGTLRCTEMKSSKKKGGSGSSRRVVKHGSLATIRNRLRDNPHVAGAGAMV